MASLTPVLAPSAGDAAAAPAPDSGSCLGGQADGCSNPAVAHSLRIAAVFIILAASSLGIWLPYIAGEACTLLHVTTKAESGRNTQLEQSNPGIIVVA